MSEIFAPTSSAATDAGRVRRDRQVVLTPASTIQVRPVRWLWQDRIPLGTLTLIGGREGIGKSLCAYVLTADITRGNLAGTYKGVPRSVIVAATEDSWEHTIVPRLMAAGADLERVYRVDVIAAAVFETGLSLPGDLSKLESESRKVEAAAILLDPLLSRLDVSLDTHKDAEVRQALEPLVRLADRSGLSVLGLIHVNKSISSDPLTTLMASRAFAAVARAVLFVMVDPDDPSVRLLGVAKNNLGRTDLPTLSFRIQQVKVRDTGEGPVLTGKLEWAGESDRSIQDALRASTQAGPGGREPTDERAKWLRDYLASKGGSADFADLRREGAKVGHLKNSLYRAKELLGVRSVHGGFPRRAFWALPERQSSPAGENVTTGNNGNTASPVVPVVPVFQDSPASGSTAPNAACTVAATRLEPPPTPARNEPAKTRRAAVVAAVAPSNGCTVSPPVLSKYSSTSDRLLARRQRATGRV